MLAPNFIGVGDEGLSIQEIKLLDPDEEGIRSPGADNIQVLDDGSAVIATFTWLDADSFDGVHEGWMNEAGDDLSDYMLTKGQSVIVYTEQPGVTVQVAGQVAATGYNEKSIAGYICLGNFTHKPMWINNVKLLDPEEEGVRCPGSDNIQLLDEGSSVKATFTWLDADSFDGIHEGFMNEIGDNLSDYILNPGEGFILYTEYEGVTIQIPGQFDDFELPDVE